MKRRMRRAKLAGKKHELRAMKDARKPKKPKSPELKKVVLTRQEIQETFELFSHYSEEDRCLIEKENGKQRRAMSWFIVFTLMLLLSVIFGQISGYSEMNWIFIGFPLFFQIICWIAYSDSNTERKRHRKSLDAHLELTQGWKDLLRDFDSGKEITMRIGGYQNKRGENMTETKCPRCGAAYTTGTDHICKPEDIQAQSELPKANIDWTR